jgi:hypothetical protein
MFVMWTVGQECEILACSRYANYLLVASVNTVLRTVFTCHQSARALEGAGHVYESINRVTSCEGLISAGGLKRY